ncbi:hypothetical protein VTI74DRAFT_5942 [Chaetomium olivicolor]
MAPSSVSTVTQTRSEDESWQKALDRLDPNLKTALISVSMRKIDVVSAVLRAADDKRQLCIPKQWRFTAPNGSVIVVRDVLEKVVSWINRYKAVGDVASQYDPVNASLPWAAFRFLLNVASGDIQAFGLMITVLEAVARIIARSKINEESASVVKALLTSRDNTQLQALLESATKIRVTAASNEFLWVKLQIDFLCRKKTEQDILETLDKGLTGNLDQIYDYALESILGLDPVAKRVAQRVISWLLFARRTLQPEALLSILRLDPDIQISEPERVDLVDVCHNLSCSTMTPTPFRSAIHLSETSCTSISPFVQEPSPIQDFYHYAAVYWPEHVRHSGITTSAQPDRVTEETMHFLFTENPPNKVINIMLSQSPDILKASFSNSCGTFGTPLNVAAFRGEVVRTGLANAYTHACHGGKEGVARLVAEENHRLGLGLWATEDQYDAVVKEAVVAGFRDLGQVAVVRALLRMGKKWTETLSKEAMAIATVAGHAEMVSFLHDEVGGVDLEVDGPFGSALRGASLMGYDRVVRLLLSWGADPRACGPLGDALQAAAQNGHKPLRRHGLLRLGRRKRVLRYAQRLDPAAGTTASAARQIRSASCSDLYAIGNARWPVPGSWI